jgi:hypothetical protein
MGLPPPVRTFAATMIAIALLAARPPGLVAQDTKNYLTPKWWLTAGGTALVLSGTLRVDPEGEGTGTEISIEDDLGMERTKIEPRAAVRWRFARRHELEAGYFRAPRENERVLTRDLTFSDTTFTAGLRTNSFFKTDQAFLTYRFAFRMRDRSQYGASVGLGMIFLRAGIDAIAGVTSGGADTAIVEFSREQDFNAPVASLGVYGRWLSGSHWYFDSDVRVLYVEFSNLRAGVVELGFATTYFFSPSFGAELGYHLGFYRVRLDRPSDENGFLGIDFIGKVDYTVNGFRLGLVFVP